MREGTWLRYTTCLKSSLPEIRKQQNPQSVWEGASRRQGNAGSRVNNSLLEKKRYSKAESPGSIAEAIQSWSCIWRFQPQRRRGYKVVCQAQKALSKHLIYRTALPHLLTILWVLQQKQVLHWIQDWGQRGGIKARSQGPCRRNHGSDPQPADPKALSGMLENTTKLIGTLPFGGDSGRC